MNRKTDWFTLKDARLQLRPYSDPCFEIAVAAQVSPSGPRLAGKFGHSLLSIGATSAGGFDILGAHWDVMEERATEFGTTVDRRKWRLVGPMHIADTKEQAYEDVRFGLPQWVDYFQRVAALPLGPDTTDVEEMADAMNASGFAVIGTPDDAAAQIQRLVDQSGGFGTFLNMAHEWADTAATRRSYELLARYVFPRFQGSAETTEASRDWAAENRPEFIQAATTAVMTAVQSHHAEKAEKQAKSAKGYREVSARPLGQLSGRVHDGGQPERLGGLDAAGELGQRAITVCPDRRGEGGHGPASTTCGSTARERASAPRGKPPPRARRSPRRADRGG